MSEKPKGDKVNPTGSPFPGRCARQVRSAACGATPGPGCAGSEY